MTIKKILSYNEIVNTFNKTELKNLYLFFGKENYLKENILNKIIEKKVEGSTKELNCKTFYGDKTKISDVIEELQTISFFSPVKTVVLKRAGKLNKSNREKLVHFLDTWKQEDKTIGFYIIYDDEKPDKNMKDIVNEKGDCVNFEPVNRRTIDLWVKARFKRSGKTIHEDALFYLKSMTDNNLSKIFNEMEKIDIFTRGKKIITKENLIGAIGNSESENIFSMLDSMGEKKVQSAIEGIVKLNTGSMHYLSILSMIHRQVKLIFQVKLMGEEKTDFNLIKKKLRLPDFIIKKLIIQSKKYSFKQLFNAYNLIMLADIELKESGKAPSIVLEELVYNIMTFKGDYISR